MEQSPRDVALARLCFAASVIDIFASAVVALILFDAIQQFYHTPLVPLACALLVPVVYLLIIEIILGGQSLGKLTLGLKVRTKNGRHAPSMRSRIARFMMKLVSLGVPSLNFNRQPFYNDTSEIYVHSDLVRNQASVPISTRTNWTLRVVGGAQAGHSIKIGQTTRFKQANVMRVGRDRAWADFNLEKYAQVSSKHCLMRVEKNQLLINDFGADGNGSSNGVYLGGRRLLPGVWTPVPVGATLLIANTQISISG